MHNILLQGSEELCWGYFRQKRSILSIRNQLSLQFCLKSFDCHHISSTRIVSLIRIQLHVQQMQFLISAREGKRRELWSSKLNYIMLGVSWIFAKRIYNTLWKKKSKTNNTLHSKEAKTKVKVQNITIITIILLENTVTCLICHNYDLQAF